MGCPLRDRDDCTECTDEKREDKYAELIEQAMLMEDEKNLRR